MMSYLPPGDDVSKSFLDFVPEYHHAKFGCNWTTNKGETEGGGGTFVKKFFGKPLKIPRFQF